MLSHGWSDWIWIWLVGEHLDLSLHDQMRIPAFSAKILQVNGQGYLPGVIHGQTTIRSPIIGPRTNKALSHKVNCASRITQQFRLSVSSGRMVVLEPRLYMCSADHLKVPCSSSARTALKYRESLHSPREFPAKTPCASQKRHFLPHTSNESETSRHQQTL